MKRIKDDYIGVKFPSGTRERIKEISKAEYYGKRSTSGYIIDCVMPNIAGDEAVLKSRKKLGGKNGR